MELSRRGFLKLSGAGVGVTALAQIGFSTPAFAAGEELRIAEAMETTTVCPYCSMGCSGRVTPAISPTSRAQRPAALTT